MSFISRGLEKVIHELIQAFPVIYVNGPRQAGKTTLVKSILGKSLKAEFRTFDDYHERNAAQQNPEIFLKKSHIPLIIDEVQMAPSIFRPLKLIIDEKREEALTQDKLLSIQYILTGSANLLALPELANAMVGRMMTLTLLPFSASESLGRHSNFLEAIFREDMFEHIADQCSVESIIREATFPQLRTLSSRLSSEWIKNYLQKIALDDPRYLYNLEKAQMMPLLLQALAIRAGSLVNDAELSRDIGMNAVTTRLYRNLLEDTFITYYLRPWYRNISKRLVKSPKVYFYDTMLLCHLLQSSPEDLAKYRTEIFGHILENFVLTEILKANTLLTQPIDLSFYRTHDGKEIDFILEYQSKIVAIEVKYSEQIQSKDLKSIKELKEEIGDSFFRGIILCNVKRVIPLEEDIFLVPFSALWSVC